MVISKKLNVIRQKMFFSAPYELKSKDLYSIHSICDVYSISLTFALVAFTECEGIFILKICITLRILIYAFLYKFT